MSKYTLISSYLLSIFSCIEKYFNLNRLAAIAATASFGLVIYVYYYPYLMPPLENRLFFYTESFMYHQYYYLVWEMYQQGEFPLWNPYILSGVPIFANTGIGFLNPFVIMGSFLYDQSSSFLANAAVFVYIAAVIIFVGNIGVYLLLRELDISRSISVITSIWYAFSGVNLAKNMYIEESTINYLFPWVICFFFKYFKYGSIRYLIYNSIIFAVILTTTHIVLITYVYLHYVLFSVLAIALNLNYNFRADSKKGLNLLSIKNILFFLPPLIGVMLASAAVFPYIEYLQNSDLGIGRLTLQQIGQLEFPRSYLHMFTILFVDNYSILGIITIAGLLFYKHEFKKYILIMLAFFFLLGLKQHGLIERLMYIFTPLGSFLLPRHYHYEVWYFVPFYTAILFAFGLETYLGKSTAQRNWKLIPIVFGIVCLLLIGCYFKIYKLVITFICSLEPFQYGVPPNFISDYLKEQSLSESQLILYFLFCCCGHTIKYKRCQQRH